MIAIVDYGMGNSGSIRNMLLRGGHEAEVTSDFRRIAEAKKLVLPGVGTFDHAVRNLRQRDLLGVLDDKVRGEGVPVLGICLGMQLLGRESEEGSLEGLSWVDARVVKLPSNGSGGSLRIPHMGWNDVRCERTCELMSTDDPQPRFYFVHSYYVQCANNEDVVGTAEYGIRFCAALKKGNVFGTQFHPEKSHKYGLRLMDKFARL